jgi:hypothetical protein
MGLDSIILKNHSPSSGSKIKLLRTQAKRFNKFNLTYYLVDGMNSILVDQVF